MVKVSVRSPADASLKSRTDGDGNALHNRILLGLPSKECHSRFLKTDCPGPETHDLLQEAGNPIRYCYFPNTAMASILNVMGDGKSVEVGLAGREGFVGLPVIAGLRSSASRVVTQAQGTAFRITADASWSRLHAAICVTSMGASCE